MSGPPEYDSGEKQQHNIEPKAAPQRLCVRRKSRSGSERRDVDEFGPGRPREAVEAAHNAPGRDGQAVKKGDPLFTLDGRAIEAVDRAMRGEGSPAPIWEGEDGVIAWLLGGPEREYHVPLPAPGEAKRAILDSYTKAPYAHGDLTCEALFDRPRGRFVSRAGRSSRDTPPAPSSTFPS